MRVFVTVSHMCGCQMHLSLSCNLLHIQIVIISAMETDLDGDYPVAADKITKITRAHW